MACAELGGKNQSSIREIVKQEDELCAHTRTAAGAPLKQRDARPLAARKAVQKQSWAGKEMQWSARWQPFYNHEAKKAKKTVGFVPLTP